MRRARWPRAGEDPLTEQEPAGRTDGNPAEQETAKGSAAGAAAAEEPAEQGAEKEPGAAAAEGEPRSDPEPATLAAATEPAAEAASDERTAEVGSDERTAEAASDEVTDGGSAAAGEDSARVTAEHVADDDHEDDDHEDAGGSEPEPDYEILALDEPDGEDDYEEDDEASEDDGEDDGEASEDDGEDDGEDRPEGFDKRPDVYHWILTPVTTLVVGPGLAASIGLFVAERATDYPRVCAPVRLANGCEETLLRMATEHAIVFLFFWLLLWVMPWWRGLRAYRIGLAVVAALILIAVPLRLIASIQVGDTY
jgi:hypothetical protein